MADPSTVTVVIPAFDEEAAIGVVIERLRSAGGWREVIVVDDGSSDQTAAIAATAGARVIRHPYNKGNGAAVKTGIRNASGEYVLIIDADGQHTAADALRLVAFLGDYDLVVAARAGADQASAARHVGNRVLNGVAELSDRPRDSGSDVGPPGRAHERPPRIPAPPAERVFHTDDNNAVVREGRV